MKHLSGFTIVEVIIVVIVVGILASLGIFAFTQVQMNARNDERASDATIISSALEEYYRENSVYPTCSQMTQSAASVADLLDIDEAALQSPSDSGGVNSIACGALSPGSGPDDYGYVVDTSSPCVTGTYCYEYTLQYRQEGTGTIISKESLRCGPEGFDTCERPGV